MPRLDLTANIAICGAPPHQKKGNVYLRRITAAAIRNTTRRHAVKKALAKAAMGARYSPERWSKAYDGDRVSVGGKGAPNHPIVQAVTAGVKADSTVQGNKAASKAAAKKTREGRHAAAKARWA